MRLPPTPFPLLIWSITVRRRGTLSPDLLRSYTEDPSFDTPARVEIIPLLPLWTLRTLKVVVKLCYSLR